MNILERIRYSRNCTNDSFPLPSPIDCLWYAKTEGDGESVDAWLRERRSADLRNNTRDHNMRKEVGQAIYMLASAYIQWHRNNIFQVWPDTCGDTQLDFAILDACKYTHIALTDAMLDDTNGINIILAMQAWCHVCALQSWDARQLVEETCADFERKHCVVREVVP